MSVLRVASATGRVWAGALADPVSAFGHRLDWQEPGIQLHAVGVPYRFVNRATCAEDLLVMHR